MGHDPFRHGRFTTIVDQRENGQNKTKAARTFYLPYPKIDYSVPDTMMSIPVGSVSRGKKYVKPV